MGRMGQVHYYHILPWLLFYSYRRKSFRYPCHLVGPLQWFKFVRIFRVFLKEISELLFFWGSMQRISLYSTSAFYTNSLVHPQCQYYLLGWTCFCDIDCSSVLDSYHKDPGLGDCKQSPESSVECQRLASWALERFLVHLPLPPGQVLLERPFLALHQCKRIKAY